MTMCIPQIGKYKTSEGTTILSLYSHFLLGEQEMFLFPDPISPCFYLVILNFFPNKHYYPFHYIFMLPELFSHQGQGLR
jgi:hypothetical protein